RELEIDSTRERQRRVTGMKALTGEVHGNERGRTRCVDGDTRPLEIEQVRESSCENAVRRTRSRERVDPLAVRHLQPEVVRALTVNAREDPRAAARQARNVLSTVV